MMNLKKLVSIIALTVLFTYGCVNSAYAETKLRSVDVPTTAECQNPKAEEYYDELRKVAHGDQLFTWVHSVWLGLCLKIQRGDISQLKAEIVFDNLVDMFDSIRFLSENLGISDRRS